MAFGKWGKYFYPCLLKENNLIFLDGSKKQNNEKNVLECLLPPIGTPVWAQGKDGDYLEKGEVVAVDVKRRRVKVSQDGFIEWIHRDRLAIQEKEIKKIQTLDPNSHGTVPVPLSAQPACETICAPVTTHLPPADIQDFSASSSLLMEHTSLDPTLHGTEPTPLSAQPACETICAPVTTQLPSADIQDFSASSPLLMEHTSLDPNSHGTVPEPLSAQPACETICAPVTTQLPSADVLDFSASSSLLMKHTSLDPNSHGTEPAPLSAQPACETICAPVTTQLLSADIQDFSASSSLLMEHTSQDPTLHGTEPTPLSAQPACETICAPVTTQLPSADIQDFSSSSSLLMEHTSLDIRHKLVQNPDIIDASSDSNMSAVFEVQVSMVSSSSLHEKKNPTYKQPIDLVFVPGINKKDDGRRIYNKELACLYCGKLLKHRLKNHLATQHSEEEEVASLLAGSKMEQNKGFQLIKHKGNFKHNIKVLEQGEGKLIVVRRSTHSSREDEYLPCIYCMGFFRVEDLWRHCGKCPFSTEEEKDINARSSVLAKSRLLLAGGLAKKTLHSFNLQVSLTSPVLKHMRKDEVFSVVIKDQLIMIFGQVLHKKLGSARAKDICQRMRQLARLKMAVAASGRAKQLIDLISGSCFDSLLKATEKLCGFSQSQSGKPFFEIPSLALRLGHLLVKCAYLKRGMAVRKDNEKMKNEAEAFLHLHKSDWTDSVSSVALASMKRKKTTKERHEIPLTSDLVKLQNYLVKNINLKIKVLKDEQSYQNWRSLAELTLARTTMFNKRRASEAAKMLVQDYIQRPNWQEMACEEIAASFTETEKSLLKRLDMVQLEGKRDRPVPLILTDEVKAALDVLLTTRSPCGVHKSNPFFFASQSETGFIDTWQVLQKVAAEAGCVQKSKITATRMRKYAATVFQVMSLKEGELDWLSRHLGHEVDTHKTYYRLHESSVELAKISRLLMAVDMGQVAKYKGKTLEDIVIDDLEDDAEICEMSDDGDESEEDGEINLHSHDDIDVLMTISETNTEGVDSGDENRQSDIAKGNMYNGSSTDSETDPPTHQRRTCKRIRNQERQNDDTDEETDDEVHATKRVCIRKIKWTEEEVSTIKTAFDHLLMKGLLPGYRQIESLQDKKKCLQRRSKAQIKSKCHQLINKEY